VTINDGDLEKRLKSPSRRMSMTVKKTKTASRTFINCIQGTTWIMAVLDYKCNDPRPLRIGRVSYLICVSMRHYVLTTSGDIVVCFRTAVCLSC